MGFMPEIPRLRGVTHVYAFYCATVAAATLIVFAPGGVARAAGAVYGIGLCALFGGSALYHRWRWNPRWRPLLRRIDHSTIFVFIAASYVPIALLVLSGGLRVAVLIAVAAGAIGGVALTVGWPAAPAWLDAAAYLALGWVAVVAAASSTPRARWSTRRGAPTRGRGHSASTRSSTRS
jgi:hemolysin III